MRGKSVASLKKRMENGRGKQEKKGREFQASGRPCVRSEQSPINWSHTCNCINKRKRRTVVKQHGRRQTKRKRAEQLQKNIHKNNPAVLFPLINYEITCAEAKEWFLSL